jgi:sec-independent protein translocase protein TatB
MFNIGMGELIFIVVLALVVVGPERLPKIMRDFGRIVRQIRLVVNEFTSQFGDEIQTFQELQEPLQELQQLANDINPVKQVTKMAVSIDETTAANTTAASNEPGTPAGPAAPQTLVKPTAAFRKPPAGQQTNPMKLIAQAKKLSSTPDPITATRDDT